MSLEPNLFSLELY